MALEQLLEKREVSTDFLRVTLGFMLHELMEHEVAGLCGAERHAHGDERVNHRNGCRERRLGRVDLKVPKWRQVVDSLRERFHRAASRMDNAEENVFAFMIFPKDHWLKPASTNCLERLNKGSNGAAMDHIMFGNTCGSCLYHCAEVCGQNRVRRLTRAASCGRIEEMGRTSKGSKEE
jgi:transposase-like protein